MNQKLFDYIRHLSKEDKKDLVQKVLKTQEEVGTLAKVTLPYVSAYATNHRFVEKQQIMEEAIDTVLCALSVAYHLDFTDEEIETMMYLKSEKWALLQKNEKDLKYPIPFEIHVTVTPAIRNQAGDLDHFREVCQSLDVKPIVLDLQTRYDDRTEVQKIISDVMTSSKHFGTNASAYEEAMRIKMGLQIRAYDVLRVKIETVPWHPAAPRSLGTMPKDCYFEAHIPCKVTEEGKHLLNVNVKHALYDLHISKNAFKKHDDGTETIMVTYRTYDNTPTRFDSEVNMIVNNLKGSGIEVGKPHKEFSIYDTKVLHDAEWLYKPHDAEWLAKIENGNNKTKE